MRRNSVLLRSADLIGPCNMQKKIPKNSFLFFLVRERKHRLFKSYDVTHPEQGISGVYTRPIAIHDVK